MGQLALMALRGALCAALLCAALLCSADGGGEAERCTAHGRGRCTVRVRVAAAGLEGWCTLKPELLAPDFDDDAAVDILLGLEPPPGLEL